MKLVCAEDAPFVRFGRYGREKKHPRMLLVLGLMDLVLVVSRNNSEFSLILNTCTIEEKSSFTLGVKDY